MVKFVGSKIRNLREEMGLTQQELAEEVGLSSEFISHLELGKRSPSLESLSSLAKFLKKDITYFIMGKEEPFDLLLKREELDKDGRRMVKKFKKYCFDYLRLEETTGIHSHLAPLYSAVSPVRMAEQEGRRLEWGNGPARSIFSLLEVNGLRIYRYPVPEQSKISGIYIFIELKQAAFALVNSSQGFGRQVCTAVHGYCHFLRDRYDGPIIDNPDIFIDQYLSLYHPREQFAQKFAASLLMPEDKVEEIIDKDIHKTRLDLDDVIYLKRYFGVSFSDMLQRLRELDCISQTRFKEYQKMEASPREKAVFGNIIGDEMIKIRKGRPILSDRFINLALLAYKKKKISEQKLARLVGKERAKLEQELKFGFVPK